MRMDCRFSTALSIFHVCIFDMFERQFDYNYVSCSFLSCTTLYLLWEWQKEVRSRFGRNRILKSSRISAETTIDLFLSFSQQV
jgi:hypothetical protein